jgi:hypothetical protein
LRWRQRGSEQSITPLRAAHAPQSRAAAPARSARAPRARRNIAPLPPPAPHEPRATRAAQHRAAVPTRSARAPRSGRDATSRRHAAALREHHAAQHRAAATRPLRASPATRAAQHRAAAPPLCASTTRSGRDATPRRCHSPAPCESRATRADTRAAAPPLCGSPARCAAQYHAPSPPALPARTAAPAAVPAHSRELHPSQEPSRPGTPVRRLPSPL